MLNQILLGDCYELMKGIPDGSVDAVVTDPPFGIGFVYIDGKEIASNPADYWSWLEPIYLEMIRVLKPGGFLAIWQTQLNFKYFWEWFGDDIHIYCAAKNFVQVRKTAINYGYDPVIMKYKPGAAPLKPKNPLRSIDYYVANTASIVSDTKRLEKSHPCPRPLDAVIQIIDNFTLPGGTILDPFAGSGTTAVAAHSTGRKFISFEKESKYHAIANKRLALAQSQLRFDEMVG